VPGETASEANKYVPALPGRYKSTHPLPQLRSSSIGAPATAPTTCQAVPQKYCSQSRQNAAEPRHSDTTNIIEVETCRQLNRSCQGSY